MPKIKKIYYFSTLCSVLHHLKLTSTQKNIKFCQILSEVAANGPHLMPCDVYPSLRRKCSSLALTGLYGNATVW